MMKCLCKEYLSMLSSETFPLPEHLYARLHHLAERQHLEPALLLERLLDWAESFGPLTELPNPEAPAPIYRLHECAKDLGVVDLAQNVDCLLYTSPSPRD